MRQKLNDLLKMRMIQRDKNPYFSSPCFMVPKKNGTYRLVVDLRDVNERVEESALVLPNLENQLTWVPPGCKYYGGLDCLSGFDMLATQEEDTKFFGISTPWGIFKMSGAPMGFINTPGVFQDRMVNEILGGVDKEKSVFATHPYGVLQWLDDSVLYAPTFQKYLHLLERILTSCSSWGLRLNVAKCFLIQPKIEWCGRILWNGKWKYKEAYFDKILKIPSPSNVGELETIVYMTTWLSLSIPGCAEAKDK